MADERTGIKYIGKEPYYKDRIFGTGLVWKSGEALPLAVEVAKEFLKHPTLFQEVKGLTPLMGSTSSSGGIQSLDEAGRKAVRRAIPLPLSKCRTFVLAGDSGVQYSDAWLSLGPYNLVNDGSGTVRVPAPHTMPTGTRGKIVNSKDDYWSDFKTITRISANEFSFPLDPRAAASLNSTTFPGGATDRLIFLSENEPNRASPFHTLNAKLGMPWRRIANIAANGMPARDMLTRLDADMAHLAALPEGLPDAFWGQLGANDVRVLAQSVDIAFARVTEYITRVNAYGIHLCYQLWQPDDSRDTAAATAGKAAIRLNRMMIEWAANQQHVTVMPTHDCLTDPTSTLGQAFAGILGTDGVHHTGVAGDMAGNCCFDFLSATYGYKFRASDKLPASVADSTAVDASSRNTFANPLLTTTGGTVGAGGTAGTSPQRVTITATGATFAPRDGDGTYLKPRTLANDGDAYGNNLVLRATFAAAGDLVQIDFAGDTSGYAVGDKIRVGCHLKTKLVSGARPKFVSTYHRPLQDAVQYNQRVLGDGYYPSTVALERDTNEVHLTQPFIVTGAITGNVMRIYVIASAAGVVDIEVGRILFETLPAA